MDSDEKKFSLDELPDMGSSSFSETPVSATPPKKAIILDPRKLAVKNSHDDKAKLAVIEKSWRFDVKVLEAGWIVYVLLLIAAQIMISSTDFRDKWVAVDNFMGGIPLLGGIIAHPAIFLILTPFIFKFKSESNLYFEINFNGISTIQKIDLKKGEYATRIFIKWIEISNVQKTKSNDRAILLISSKEGPLAQMIWDIDEDKKRGVKHLLNSLVVPAHPFRKFLEKELP